MNDMDGEVQRIERGDAWLETDDVVEIEVKRPLDKVVPVRLRSEQWDELRRAARVRGVDPTALVQMWVLERLREVPVT